MAKVDKALPHGCTWCPWRFATLSELVAHLTGVHPKVKQRIGQQLLFFHAYRMGGDFKIRCVCDRVFTANYILAPAFAAWAQEHRPELDSFLAHLRRAGGSWQEHYEAVKLRAVMDRIEGGTPSQRERT